MKKTISQIIAFTITALLFSCQRTIESDAELAAAVDSTAIVIDSIAATTANK